MTFLCRFLIGWIEITAVFVFIQRTRKATDGKFFYDKSDVYLKITNYLIIIQKTKIYTRIPIIFWNHFHVIALFSVYGIKLFHQKIERKYPCEFILLEIFKFVFILSSTSFGQTNRDETWNTQMKIRSQQQNVFNGNRHILLGLARSHCRLETVGRLYSFVVCPAALIQGNHRNCTQFASSKHIDWLVRRLEGQESSKGIAKKLSQWIFPALNSPFSSFHM